MDVLFEGTAGTQLVALTCPEETEQLIALFSGVATEQGWQPGENLRDLPGRCRYFAALVDGEIAGGMQLVLPDDSGWLPCFAVWPEAAGRLSLSTVHGTITVLRSEFRGHHGLFWPLCVEAWRFCTVRSVEYVAIEATPPMLERYRRVGWPLEVIGELRTHWGEDCYLCRMATNEIAGMLLTRSVRTPFYRSLVAQAMRPASCIRCAANSAVP